jgi:co-chaperonin GroES (HSP10)
MELTDKKILPTKILLKKPEKKEKTTATGIIIPGSADEITSLGTVVLVGSAVSALDQPIKAGDQIMFPPRAVMRVRFEDQDFYLLSLQDVLLFWSPSASESK